MLFFETFLMQFWLIFMGKWARCLIEFNITLKHDEDAKCWKNQCVFNDFASSRVWCTIKFWMKSQPKKELECRHRFCLDFGLILGPSLESKSVLNRLQSGLERDLEEDSYSTVKKKSAKFSAGVVGRLKVEDFGASGGGKQGGGICLHTPDNPWTSQGVGG